MKRFFLYIFCISSISFAYDPQNQMQNTPTQTMHSTHGCIGKGFITKGEFLWWRADAEDLEYAFTVDPTLAQILFLNNLPDSTIVLQDINFKYGAGLRLSAGYDFGETNWDLMVRWVNYSHRRFSFTPGLPDDNTSVIVLIGFPVNAPEGTPITFGNNASADWKLYFNSWQLELGYDYFISKVFSIRPHMGVQASWIRQSYDQDFHNVIIATTSNPDFYGILSTRSKLRRWGLGPRVGIEGNCHMGWGFSLQSISSIALLYGQFDNRYRRHIESVNTLTSEVSVSNVSPYRLRANAQLSFGLEWAYCFGQNYLLAFNAAYEAQYWWDQMELFTLYNLLPTGDLTFNGLTLGGRFEF